MLRVVNGGGQHPVAPDLPEVGSIIALMTPTGHRFYRVAGATAHRIQLKPLSREQTQHVLAVQERLRLADAWRRGFANFGLAIMHAAELVQEGRVPWA